MSYSQVEILVLIIRLSVIVSLDPKKVAINIADEANRNDARLECRPDIRNRKDFCVYWKFKHQKKPGQEQKTGYLRIFSDRGEIDHKTLVMDYWCRFARPPIEYKNWINFRTLYHGGRNLKVTEDNYDLLITGWEIDVSNIFDQTETSCYFCDVCDIDGATFEEISGACTQGDTVQVDGRQAISELAAGPYLIDITGYPGYTKPKTLSTCFGTCYPTSIPLFCADEGKEGRFCPDAIERFDKCSADFPAGLEACEDVGIPVAQWTTWTPQTYPTSCAVYHQNCHSGQLCKVRACQHHEDLCTGVGLEVSICDLSCPFSSTAIVFYAVGCVLSVVVFVTCFFICTTDDSPDKEDEEDQPAMRSTQIPVEIQLAHNLATRLMVGPVTGVTKKSKRTGAVRKKHRGRSSRRT